MKVTFQLEKFWESSCTLSLLSSSGHILFGAYKNLHLVNTDHRLLPRGTDINPVAFSTKGTVFCCYCHWLDASMLCTPWCLVLFFYFYFLKLAVKCRSLFPHSVSQLRFDKCKKKKGGGEHCNLLVHYLFLPNHP